jgi:Tfp pilus assembly protein PilF
MKTKALLSILAAIILSACSSNELKQPTPEQKKADVYYGQGTTELVNKNYAQALNYLVKAKELDPNNSGIRNNLGMAYYFRDQVALAEKELKEAVALDPKNSDAHLNLGSLYLAKNRLKDARAEFAIVEGDLTFNGQFRNFYNIAMVALKEGDRREAFDYLAKSIKEKEDYCLAHFKLGELYSEEFRYKQALDSFKESGKGTCVNEAAPVYQQAMTLVNLNRPLEAKRKFEEVMERYSSTRYSAMASIQLKKLTNTNEQQSTKASQTELIKSESVETPNF